MKKIATASTALMVVPNLAHAAENSPQVIIFSGIASLIIFGIILLLQMSASKNAMNPSNENFADQSNISYKLNHRIDQNSTYKITIYRQSGNVERVEGPITGKNVSEKILTSMRRASITAVSITNEIDGIFLRRVIYNARGRQEGKRIGGYKITEISSARTYNSNAFVAETYGQCEIVKSVYFGIKSTLSEPMDELIQAETLRTFKSSFDAVSGKGSASLTAVQAAQILAYSSIIYTGKIKLTQQIRDHFASQDDTNKMLITDPNVAELMWYQFYDEHHIKIIVDAFKNYVEQFGVHQVTFAFLNEFE